MKVRAKGAAMRVVWTDEMRRLVRDRTAAGWSVSEIAAEIGVSSTAVSHVLHQMRTRGCERQRAPGRMIDWTHDMDEALRGGLAAGRRVADVAKQIGVPRGAIYRRISALGLCRQARLVTVWPEQTGLVRRMRQRAAKPPRPPQHAMPARGLGRDFTHRVTIVDLRLTTCRFPTWANDAEPRPDEAFYCGAPVEPGKTCCPDCRGFVFAPLAQGRVG